MKFLIVVLDGLRPDQLDEAVTPNLAELSKIDLRLARHTSFFPVGRAFHRLRGIARPMESSATVFWQTRRSIDVFSLSALMTLGSERGGVLTVSTVGEVLASHDSAMLSIGAQSQGSFGLSGWGFGRQVRRRSGFMTHQSAVAMRPLTELRRLSDALSRPAAGACDH
ncbi:hypothetical protein [Bradyrhizobium vignae]|uniref:hypothetical protein n=1 Tax=Bradyrhizobium vignae TaxID=1549949 RepID=UPI00100BDBA1|nr:hypothetical protein [Bradyrhizobium vignae]RXG91864.1 hypothetical protein EAV90_27500 [Bradyrhizobium vignae]